MSERSSDNRPPADAEPPALDYAVPTLDYASFAADGVPEWNPEVEAAIDRGERIARLASYFARTDVASRYLSRSIELRFAPDAAGKTCDVCGARATRLAVVSWSFRVPGRTFAVRARYTQTDGSTVTHHPLCRQCHARWARRMTPLARFQTVMTWLSLLGGVAILANWIARTVGLPLPREASWALIIGLVVSLALGSVAKVVESYLMPRAIWRRVPRWLAYESLLHVAGRRQFRDRPPRFV